MTRFTLALITLTAATPAFANYGDLEMNIDELSPQVAMISQPLLTPSYVVATEDTCTLPSDHIVSVPVTFTSETTTEMACLTTE